MEWHLIGLMGLALVLAPTPVPGQTSKRPTDTTSDVHDNTAREEKPTVSLPIVNSSTGKENNNSADKPPNNDKPYSIRITALPSKDWADWITWIAGIVLIVIGGAGVYFALRTVSAIEDQGKLMKQQANLMEQQVTLMQVPFRSWVKLDDWSVEYSPGPSPPGTSKFQIQVRVVNQSEFPITLTGGGMRFGNVGTAAYSRYEAGGHFVPPKTGHPIKIWIFASEYNVKQFTEGSVFIPTDGEFSHYGPLGKEHAISQPFSGFLECGQMGARFHYALHMNPRKAEDSEEPEQQDEN